MNVTIPCICPGEPHDSDEVTLRDRLDFRQTVAVQKSVLFLGTDPSNAEIMATLTEAYLLYGIEAWSVRDERGKAVPITRQAIEEHLLANVPAALAVADAADDLYQETVLLPLLMRGSASSATTPTTASTSRRSGSRPVPLKPSKRSSTSTTRTDATATTTESPDGDSSSSQSSVSAA